MNKSLGAIVLAGAFLWGGTSSTANAEPKQIPGGDRRYTVKHSVLATSLLDDAGLAAAGNAASSFNVESPVDSAGRIKVQLTAPASTATAAIKQVGGAIDVSLADRSTAFVPTSRLRDLAAMDGITSITEPLRAIPEVITSQGVAETGANLWQAGGHGGAGVKIAILDVGFLGYGTAQAAGEVPSPIQTSNQCTNINAENHGTAVVETVFDMAPNAQYYLICVDDDLDILAAASFITNNGINIVNASLGNPLWGRGDGSGGAGTVPNMVRTQREQGVLWVVSAGNDGQRHYHFTGVGLNSLDSVVRPNGSPLYSVNVAPRGVLTVALKWDSWPTTNQDFDVYLYDSFNGYLSVEPVAGSNDNQSGSQNPVEFFGVQNPNNVTTTVYIEVSSGRPDVTNTATRFDLFLDGNIGIIDTTTGSSISEPATSPYVLTAGAHQVHTNSPEPFSSRGPTIDERIKPDISGPDGTTNSVFGSFIGTSAAAPHVTGAAAILKGANPALEPAEVQLILESRAVDIGAAGKDNDNGTGKLNLGPVGIPNPPTGELFTPLATPVRLLDTRFPCSGTNPKCTNFAPSEQFDLTVASLNGVPANATAVVLNVTAAGPNAAGWLTIWPTGGVAPTTSSLNFEFGQVVANNVTATLGSQKVSILNTGGTTPVIVDLTGYFAPGAVNGFVSLNPPRRALDTRTDVGGHQAPLAPGEEIALGLTNFLGASPPPGVSAVALNVTVTAPTHSGWITAYPNGVTPRPNVSSLNFTPGLTVANLVMAKIGTTNQVRFFNSSGATHLIVDVVGYYVAGSGGRYVALNPPSRDLDTRYGNGDTRQGPPHPYPLGAGEFTLQAALLYGVPSDASAVVLNVTVVNPSNDGFLSVYPAGAAFPGTSSLNFAAGKIVPNAVVTSLGAGKVTVYNYSNLAHVLSDINGYFT